VGNTLTQRTMKTDSCEAIVKIELEGLGDGQFAGICHFAGTYSAFGVRQTEGVRRLVYDNNRQRQLVKSTLLLRQHDSHPPFHLQNDKF
jgi:hypothetical protein